MLCLRESIRGTGGCSASKEREARAERFLACVHKSHRCRATPSRQIEREVIDRLSVVSAIAFQWSIRHDDGRRLDDGGCFDGDKEACCLWREVGLSGLRGSDWHLGEDVLRAVLLKVFPARHRVSSARIAHVGSGFRKPIEQHKWLNHHGSLRVRQIFRDDGLMVPCLKLGCGQAFFTYQPITAG